MNTNYVIIAIIGLVAFLLLNRNGGGVRVINTNADDSGLEKTALEAIIRDRELTLERNERREQRAFELQLRQIERDTELEKNRMARDLLEAQEKRYYQQLEAERQMQYQMQREQMASSERMGFLQLIGSAVGSVFAFLLSDAEYYNQYAKRVFPYNAGELEMMSAKRYREVI